MSSNGPKLTGDSKTLGNISESRLWKVLDDISDRIEGNHQKLTNRLETIEHQLLEVVRLEEQVKNHDQALYRYAKRLENHDGRLREAEMWQASHYGDNSSLERTVSTVKKDMDKIATKVDGLENIKEYTKGHIDVGAGIFKWAAAILAAVLIYIINKG